jgi:hypothetical protein
MPPIVPIALTDLQLDAIMRACERSGRPIVVASWRPWPPLCRVVRSVMAASILRLLGRKKWQGKVGTGAPGVPIFVELCGASKRRSVIHKM